MLLLKKLVVNSRTDCLVDLDLRGLDCSKGFHEFQGAIAALGRGQSQRYSSPCAVVQLDPYGGVL